MEIVILYEPVCILSKEKRPSVSESTPVLTGFARLLDCSMTVAPTIALESSAERTTPATLA